MRYAELGRYVDALSRSGSDTKKLRVERALKLSVPFACLIIALFGAPLAISTPRSGTAWGVAVCLATTFVDLLMFQLSKAVGAGGALPPAFAAWVPNGIFGAAGVVVGGEGGKLKPAGARPHAHFTKGPPSAVATPPHPRSRRGAGPPLHPLTPNGTPSG